MPFTIIILALITGIIILAIYVRNRSLVMLSVLGIYASAAFGVLLTSKYISAQYQEIGYVVILGFATAVTLMVLKLVKE